jgi:hypothetical protein
MLTLDSKPAPEPVDPYDADIAELADRSKPNDQNPYLKKHNSRIVSALKGAVVSGGRAANIALASGDRNPLAAALGGAGGGLVGGGINDRWDEVAANEKRKAELQQNVGFTLERRKREGDISDQESTDALRTAQTAALPLKTLAEVNKSKGDILNAQQSRILEEYKAAGHYTPGENADFESRAAGAGMKLTPYSAKEAAPGRFKNGDQEYEYVKGADGQYHGRPVTDGSGQPLGAGATRLKAGDLPDTLFNLPDDKAISDSARASIEPMLSSTELRDSVPTARKKSDGTVARVYRNEDGTPNLDEIWKDIASGEINASAFFKDVKPKDDQLVAAARQKIRKQVDSDRALVDDFRLRVTRNQSRAGATETPVASVVKRFNEIRQLSGKQRDEALKTFYQTLPYLDVK